jgi:hypothetical protein
MKTNICGNSGWCQKPHLGFCRAGGICVAQVFPESGLNSVVRPGTGGIRMSTLQPGH